MIRCVSGRGRECLLSLLMRLVLNVKGVRRVATESWRVTQRSTATLETHNETVRTKRRTVIDMTGSDRQNLSLSRCVFTCCYLSLRAAAACCR